MKRRPKFFNAFGLGYVGGEDRPVPANGASASGRPRGHVGLVISGTSSLGFYPYGEAWSATANDKDKFATYYRDSATGLDYAMNRYYSATNGRFLSPDPYVASAGAGSPQSWKRDGYVENDPVNKLDPAGRKLLMNPTASRS